MNICVIDNYIDKTLSIDFAKLFVKINNTVIITTYNSTDIDLLHKIRKGSFDAIILTGSERRVKKDTVLPAELIKLKIPILGICYGFQWMTHILDGKIHSFDNDKNCNYTKFIEIDEPFVVSRRLYTFSHHDYITKVPKKFIETVNYNNMIIMAFDKNNKHIGVQFHPEKHNPSSIEFFRSWMNWLK
jgi:GMP synthase (glutamine-hydrolysing)